MHGDRNERDHREQAGPNCPLAAYPPKHSRLLAPRRGAPMWRAVAFHSGATRMAVLAFNQGARA